MLNLDLRPGDIIGFTGCDRVSHFINLGSLGVPYFGISHVAIVGVRDNRFPSPLVYESCGCGGRPPCARLKREVQGFQCHLIDDLIHLDYHAIYWYRLKCPLYQHEEQRLERELNDLLGRPYDYTGAGKSGGGLLCQLATHVLGKENMGAVFCSEAVAFLETKVGRFLTKNSGAWNPNSLVRAMRRGGVLEPGIKIGPIPREEPLAS